jgi:hypothetical protein
MPWPLASSQTVPSTPDRVAGGHDAGGRRRQSGVALVVAPAQAAGGVPVVVLHHDPSQGLHPGPAEQDRKAGCQVLK